jgi:tRNA (guanine37-N1)-methyltransferase
VTVRVDVITIFPELVEGVLGYSILRRAREGGVVEVQVHDLREHTADRHDKVDDEPFGGGGGMVMQVGPFDRALRELGYAPGPRPERTRVVLMSPQGKVLDQEGARRLAGLDRLAILCGRYEGIDERVLDRLVDEEISIGDYVLSGGELPALVALEALVRLLPGAIGRPESFQADSHFEPGLLDHPHYTRPAEYEGWEVPEVLLSGDHERVRLWRRRKALEATARKRPDLLARAELAAEDIRLLRDVLGEEDLPAEARRALEEILRESAAG